MAAALAVVVSTDHGVVAEQVTVCGRRRFWGVPMRVMFDRLKAHPALSLYEVVDSKALCRLYFDVEYNRCCNPGRTQAQDAAVASILVELSNAALCARGLSCDTASVWVLDASDCNRFSQHIIVGVHGQGYLGPVQTVRMLAVDVASAAVAQYPGIFMVSKPGQQVESAVVDLSVYNTNQQFRVAYSSKFGQCRPLLPFNRQRGVPLLECTWSMFESMLIVCGRSIGAPSTLQAAGRSLPASLGVGCMRPAAACYPALEAHLGRHLLFGHLKEAKVHRQEPFIVPCLYWSTTSRYCPAMGREHKSNHMQVVVNVATCAWRFHCLDPACVPGAWVPFDPSMLQRLHPAAQHLQQWHDYWAKQRV